MSRLNEELGRRVREIRKQRGLTQESIAEGTGLTAKFISEVERGKTNPSLRTLERITTVLNLSLPELFSFAPKRQKTRQDLLIDELSRFARGQDPHKVELLLKAFKVALS